MLGGLIAGTLIFWKGLNITNFTDLVLRGLWITIDLSSISLAGVFSLCAAVHLFGLKNYEPVVRTATFIGLIGYTMTMLALVYWNLHLLL